MRRGSSEEYEWKKRGSRYNFDWHRNDKTNPNREPDWKAPIQYEQFCGEAVLKEAYEDAHYTFKRGYFTGLFVTGARASEFLQFTCNQFEKDDRNGVIWGRGLPVLKREEGAKRTINFLIEDPLAKEFYSYVEDIRKVHGETAYLTEPIRVNRDEWLRKYDAEVQGRDRKS
ncbi:MAG: hypothetical protein NTY03_01300 [Candidatus Bathyarchaeota archaeon]|nr:hypothetical protein [Candidatus Bathyarchaeota archaeon]